MHQHHINHIINTDHTDHVQSITIKITALVHLLQHTLKLINNISSRYNIKKHIENKHIKTDHDNIYSHTNICIHIHTNYGLNSTAKTASTRLL